MRTRLALSSFAAAVLSTTGTHAATWDASASLRHFDETVARGLPQPAFPLIATSETGLPTSALLVVSAKLDTVVELPDGTTMTTYVGSWNGSPATISHGDGQLLVDIDAPFDRDTPGLAVARFDAAVTGAFPAHVPLSDPEARPAPVVNESDDLLVSGELGGDIVFADGSHGRMYDATWHGTPAVVTRSEGHLDVTSRSATGITVTGFTAGSDKVEHATPAASGPPMAMPALPLSTMPAVRARRSTKAELVPNRLTFHMMLHDDVADLSSQRIHASYIAWWLADLQRNILHGKKVDVLYSTAIPGVTDMPYQHVGSLHNWSNTIDAYAQEQHIPRTYKHKFMLTVKGLPEIGRHGRAWQKGSDGIASISGRYPEIAHQLGHLLGAKHGNAEVRFGGWWCETNMYTPSLLVRSNCYGYSTANMRLIDNYIRTGEGFAPHLRWSEDR